MSVMIKMCHRRTKYPAPETDECVGNPEIETIVRQFRVSVRNLGPEYQSGAVSTGILVRNLRGLAIMRGPRERGGSVSRKYMVQNAGYFTSCPLAHGGEGERMAMESWRILTLSCRLSIGLYYHPGIR